MKISISLFFIIAFLNSISQVETYTNYRYHDNYFNAFCIKIDSSTINNFDILQNKSKENHDHFINGIIKKDSFQYLITASISDKNCQPEGFFAVNHKVVNQVNFKNGDGNFYLKPNGAFLVTSDTVIICESDQIQNYKDIRLGIQSGPMLVSNNSIVSNLNRNSTNRNIRCGVGEFADSLGNTYLIFVSSSSGVTFYELANLFYERFKCSNALCLESINSGMYYPGIPLIPNQKSVICNYIRYKE